MLSPADIRRLHPEEFEFLWRALLRREHGNTYRHVDGHGVDCITGETAYQLYHHQGASFAIVRGKFRHDLQAALKAREEGKLSFNRWIFVTTFAFKDPAQIEWLEAQKASALPALVETWGDEDLASYAARHPDVARLVGVLHEATPAAPTQVVGAAIAAVGGAGGGAGIHIEGGVRFENAPPVTESTATVSCLEQGQAAILCVKNDGALAQFYATLRVAGPVYGLKGSEFARWTHSDAVKVTIPRGVEFRAKLAELEWDSDARFARWRIFGVTQSGMVDDARAQWSSCATSEPLVRAPDLVVSGQVIAEPDLRGGPKPYRVVLQAFGVEEGSG